MKFYIIKLTPKQRKYLLDVLNDQKRRSVHETYAVWKEYSSLINEIVSELEAAEIVGEGWGGE